MEHETYDAAADRRTVASQLVAHGELDADGQQAAERYQAYLSRQASIKEVVDRYLSRKEEQR